MKCSEYLWKRIALDTAAPDEWSPEQVTRELRAAMTKAGDTAIVSDTTGEPMSERDALSVYGLSLIHISFSIRSMTNRPSAASSPAP